MHKNHKKSLQKEVSSKLPGNRFLGSREIVRSAHSVYWPGLWEDLQRTRNQCKTCTTIAPSQAKLPPIDPITPEYPFQHICADYFMLDGHSYRVFVDRFTGWPGIFKGDTGEDVTNFLARVSMVFQSHAQQTEALTLCQIVSGNL